MLSAVLSFTGVFEGLDNMLYSKAFVLKEKLFKKNKTSPIVQIEISDAAIQNLPEGISVHANLAQMFSVLNLYGTQIFFPSFIAESSSSLQRQKMLGAIQSGTNCLLPAAAVPKKIVPLLKEKESPSREKSIEKYLWYPKVLNGKKLESIEQLVLPSEDFCRFAKSLGIVAGKDDYDSDGVLRKISVFYSYKDAFIPSFAFAAAAEVLQIQKESILLDCGNVLSFKCLNGQEYKIPVDSKGRIYIPYSSAMNFTKLNFEYFASSLSDTGIESTIESMLKDKTVFITDSTFCKIRGSENFVLTPQNTALAENKIQLLVLNAFLTNSFIKQYPFWATILTLLTLVLAVYFASFCKNSILFIILSLLTGAVFFCFEFFMFALKDYVPCFASAITIISVCLITEIIFRIFNLKKENYE